MIIFINTLDGSKLVVIRLYLICMSVQVDHASLALIPAEAVETNQEHFVANKVGGRYHVISLVTLCA